MFIRRVAAAAAAVAGEIKFFEFIFEKFEKYKRALGETRGCCCCCWERCLDRTSERARNKPRGEENV